MHEAPGSLPERLVGARSPWSLAARSSSRLSLHCVALDVDSCLQARAARTTGARYSVFQRAYPHLLPSATTT